MFNFFKKKTQIVVTDSSLKPSERYSLILFDQLSKEGYKYLKSKKEFVQDFKYGKRILSMSFISTSGYINSVQFFYHIIFEDIEKIFKRILPNYGWTNWTINYNLSWTDKWLCDTTTGEYSDKTLNDAAYSFFEKIKPQIDELNIRFSSYEFLYKEYTSKPEDDLHFVSRIEKRVIIGLILTKHFNPNNYEMTKSKFQILLDKYKGKDKRKCETEIDIGFEYMENNSIKLNTTPFQ